MHLSLKLHGPFHKLSDRTHYQVKLPTNTPTLEQLLDALKKDLQNSHPNLVKLLPACRFAQHQTIITNPEQTLDAHAEVVVLPPVSGG